MIEASATEDQRPGEVAPNVAPPPGNPRFPLIDVIRGIIVLTIMVGHSLGRLAASNPYRDQLGWGVGVFFVISGFLLYRPFVAAEARQAPPLRVRDFYRRRVLRIVPGYWLALTVLGLAYSRLGTFGPDSWRYYGLVQSYSQRTYGGGLGASWSLSIEASLYLVLPMVAVVIARLHRPGRTDSWALDFALVTAVAAICLGLLLGYREHFSHVPAALIGNSMIFMFGMALAALSVGTRSSTPIAGSFAFVERHTGGCWLGALMLFIVGAWERNTNFDYLIEGAMAVLFILPAIVDQGKSKLVRGVLSNRLLAWIGLISYGLYLWHDVLLFELRGGGTAIPLERSLIFTAVAWCATFAFATSSYYLVELPIMRYGRTRLDRRRTQTALSR